MYTEVRQCLAVDFPHDCGPESCHDPGKEIKDMDSEEYESYRKRLEEEKQKIKLGYQRIKEKVKNVRQDYRSAVNKGTRSGSGKVVQDIMIYYLIYGEVPLLRRHCLSALTLNMMKPQDHQVPFLIGRVRALKVG